MHKQVLNRFLRPPWSEPCQLSQRAPRHKSPMVTLLIWARVDSEGRQAWDKLASTGQERSMVKTLVLKGPCSPRAHTKMASAASCKSSFVASPEPSASSLQPPACSKTSCLHLWARENTFCWAPSTCGTNSRLLGRTKRMLCPRKARKPPGDTG